MKKQSSSSFQWKAFLLLFLCINVPCVTTWYVVNNVTKSALLQGKGTNLLSFAKILGARLPQGGYAEILKNAGAESADRETKIQVLNRALAPATDEMSLASTGLGIGFYSLELDSILTYGPSAEYGNTVGRSIAPDHPGRVVMSANTPNVASGTMVRGNIMNAMYPLERGGTVIGYTWANELTTEIETYLRTTERNILILVGASYILTLILVAVIFRRTAVLERKALQAAEASNLAQKEFLARMSHEIRTPMNGVLGMTHLALRGSPPPEQQVYLKKIQASASLLLGIINDILDFSKIEAGKLVIEKYPFKLRDMVEHVRDLISPRTDEKGMELLVTVDDAVPEYVLGDELRLSQVLLNLLGNAVKFSSEGAVVLEMKCDESEEPPSPECVRLFCSVKDSGVGMSEEQQAALFKPFTQADGSIARKFGGTGLGLFISKTLIECMGGEIGVKSALGQGCEFFFSVDLEPCDESAEDEESGELFLEGQNYEGHRFLLVEDNIINQEVALAMLSEFNAEIDVASNGEEGLNAFLRQEYSLIFMDMQMPVMDGLEATRRIRAFGKPGAPAVPIIAMTANAMREDREACANAGMNEYVSKPLDLQELKSAVYHAMNRLSR